MIRRTIAVALLPLIATVARADDAEMAALIPPGAKVERLTTGLKFLEGPVWIADGANPADGYLVFSDNVDDTMYQWSPAKNERSIFRKPSGSSNGNTTDREGRLVTCSQTSRSVNRIEKDGAVTVLVDRFEGKRFNSPNDVVVKSDGSIWFTDPPYGLPKGEKRELDRNLVFRFDPADKSIVKVADDLDWPNGICFSPDESKLYVAQSSGKRGQGIVHVYDVKPGNTLGPGRLFCTAEKGAPDGIRVDQDGRLWAGCGDGAEVFGSDGRYIGHVPTPETTANLAFGGADGKTLFMTAGHSLHSIRLTVGPATRPAGK